jgi:hypothetical protein
MSTTTCTRDHNHRAVDSVCDPEPQTIESWAVVNTGTGEVMALEGGKQAAINRAHAYYGTTKAPVAARRVTLRVESIH